MAGQAWADWLFMLGLLGIGVALIAGVAMRAAAAAGSLLLVLMWTAVLPPDNNPFLDDHLIYALLLVVLALTAAGRGLGFGAAWEKLPFVKQARVLAMSREPRTQSVRRQLLRSWRRTSVCAEHGLGAATTPEPARCGRRTP